MNPSAHAYLLWITRFVLGKVSYPSQSENFQSRWVSIFQWREISVRPLIWRLENIRDRLSERLFLSYYEIGSEIEIGFDRWERIFLRSKTFVRRAETTADCWVNADSDTIIYCMVIEVYPLGPEFKCDLTCTELLDCIIKWQKWTSIALHIKTINHCSCVYLPRRSNRPYNTAKVKKWTIFLILVTNINQFI